MVLFDFELISNLYCAHYLRLLQKRNVEQEYSLPHINRVGLEENKVKLVHYK